MTLTHLQRVNAVAAVLAGTLLALGQVLSASAGDPGSTVADVLVIASHVAYVFAIVGFGLVLAVHLWASAR